MQQFLTVNISLMCGSTKGNCCVIDLVCISCNPWSPGESSVIQKMAINKKKTPKFILQTVPHRFIFFNLPK